MANEAQPPDRSDQDKPTAREALQESIKHVAVNEKEPGNSASKFGTISTLSDGSPLPDGIFIEAQVISVPSRVRDTISFPMPETLLKYVVYDKQGQLIESLAIAGDLHEGVFANVGSEEIDFADQNSHKGVKVVDEYIRNFGLRYGLDDLK